MQKAQLAVICSALALAGACVPSTGGDDSCTSAKNGVCDEPTLCVLGTDASDCNAACAATNDEVVPYIAAACAHRDGHEVDQIQSMGDSGVGHWRDDTFAISGAAGTESVRHHRLYRPAHLAMDKEAPLVVMLPGNRVSHYSLSNYTALEQAAEAHGFVLVHAEQPWRQNYFSWSWYTDWDWANNASQNPDLIFLRALIEHLVDTENIDRSRIYLAGHSRGAAMSLIAALEMPDLIAGAVPQSGFVEFGYYDRLVGMPLPEPLPRLYFMHGAVDDDVCIDCTPGGRCGVTPARQCGSTASSDALVAALRDKGYPSDRLRYARLENVAHRWQPWLNHVWWDFFNEGKVSTLPKGAFGHPDSGALKAHIDTSLAAPLADLNAVSVSRGTEASLPVGRYGDGWFVNEQPGKELDVAAFQIDAREVSVEDWAAYIQWSCGNACLDPRMPIGVVDGAVVMRAGYAKRPITYVSRQMASSYCTWHGKRLPTELEFERAAKGAENATWPWLIEGGPRCSHTNFGYEGGRCAQEAYDVGTRPDHQSAEGVYDLAGNVAEWVADDYGPYENAFVQLPGDDIYGVVRGGSFLMPRILLRPSARLPVPVKTRAPDIGFRCARGESDRLAAGIQAGEMPAPEPVGTAGSVEMGDAYLDGLRRPRALIAMGDTLWVSTDDGVVLVDTDKNTTLVDGAPVDKWQSDDTGVFGLRLDLEEICRYEDDGIESCLDVPDVVDFVVHGGDVVWTNGTSVFRETSSGRENMLNDRTGLRSLVSVGTTLWFIEGGSNGTDFYRWEELLPEAQPELVLGADAISPPLQILHPTPGAQEEIWLLIGLADLWPHSALLCRMSNPSASLQCLSQTPPKSGDLHFWGDKIVWRHQFGIASISESAPYEIYRGGISPGGTFLQNDVLWVSEPMQGKVFRWSDLP